MDFRSIKLPVRVNSNNSINPTHCAYLYGYLIINDAGTDAFYTSYKYPFEVENSQDAAFYVKRSQFVTWWMSLTDEQRIQYKTGQIQDSYYAYLLYCKLSKF